MFHQPQAHQQLMVPHRFLWLNSPMRLTQLLQQLVQDAVSTTTMTQTVFTKDLILELRWFTTMLSHLRQALQQTKQELMEPQEEHLFKSRLIRHQLLKPQQLQLLPLQPLPLQPLKHPLQLLPQHLPLPLLTLADLTKRE